jgi:hypothetical protein
MGREDQVIKHLAARDGRVIAEEGIYQASAILEVGVVGQYELQP